MGKKILLALAMVVIIVVLLVVATRCSKEEKNDIIINKDEGPVNIVEEKDIETIEKEISYNTDKFVIRLKVPTIVEDGKETVLYKFQKEPPKDKGYNKGTFFLKSDELLLGFETTKYFHQNDEAFKSKNGTKNPTFKDFMTFIQDKSYTGKYKNPTMVKIGERNAARVEFRRGEGDNNLRGYIYIIDMDDLLKDEFLELMITPVNSKTGVVEELIESEDVTNMLDSITFFK